MNKQSLYYPSGRRTRPSLGLTRLDYGAADSMVMQTQNDGAYITYGHDLSRPIHIAYSDCPWDDVWYEYGGSETGTGRLVRLYTNSTWIGQLLQGNTYKYDNAGNIVIIDDNGLNARNQYFEYDNINRLTHSKGCLNCQGTGIGYETDYTYSAAGRMLKKNVTSQRMNTTAGLSPMDYQNNYTYLSTSNPFAVRSVQDALSGSVNNFDRDANGNLIKSSCGGPVYDRRLCWTEDNRLQGYWELSDNNGDIAAWYNYNAVGERNFKITSPSLNMRQNAAGLRYGDYLKFPTLYASALVTVNKGGYTKHYFEGANRVCSKIGGGFHSVHWGNIEDQVPALASDYDQQIYAQHESVERTFGECLGIGVEMDSTIDLYEVLAHEAGRDDMEPAFYYHSDHLGSAAYLTNDAGQVTQTLNYLPYGEDWVDIQHYSETRYPSLGIYTYNGKEKDYESGFHHYGARYYWSEVLTGWLSVDPIMDKYPGVSPYSYCDWNPVMLIDPDGRKIRFAKGTTREQQEQFYAAVRYLDAHNYGGRFGQLKNSKMVYTVSFIDHLSQTSSYNTSTKTIHWCPMAGLETDQGHILSPATILNHEMTHATHHDDALKKYAEDLNTYGKDYADKEWEKYTQSLEFDSNNPYNQEDEREVITVIEQRTAKLLGEIREGEVTRENHKGKLVPVEGPTSNVKTEDLIQ